MKLIYKLTLTIMLLFVNLIADDNVSNISDEDIIGKEVKLNQCHNLTIHACGVVKEAFVIQLNKAFSKKYGCKVEINSKKKGDMKILNSVHSKEITLGSGCRGILKDDENETLISLTQVAWGALVIIVNEKNQLKDIKTKQIKDILTGKITNWKALGGEDKNINLYTRKPGKKSGIGYSTRNIIFEDIEKKLFNAGEEFYKNSSSDIREAVIKDPYALAIDDVISSQKVEGLKILTYNGIEASKENLLTKKYLLVRPLYLYLPTKTDETAKRYVRFALSKEGQAVLSELDIADLVEEKGELEKDYLLEKFNFQIKSR